MSASRVPECSTSRYQVGQTKKTYGDSNRFISCVCLYSELFLKLKLIENFAFPFILNFQPRKLLAFILLSLPLIQHISSSSMAKHKAVIDRGLIGDSHNACDS